MRRRVFATGKIPSPRMQEEAARHPVECRCGHTAPLLDVQFWPLIGEYHGTCPECGQSFGFIYPPEPPEAA